MSEPMSSRQFVAADFAPTGGGTFVAGHRDADGTVYIDQWEADLAPGPTITVEQGRFTAPQAGWHAIGSPRTASDFLVDLDAPPNSCTRCGTDQRGHGEQHAYAAPTDAVRLARMKSRRDRRHATLARFDLTPETLVELRVNTGILTAALARLQEGFDEMARVTGPVVQAIRDRHDVIAAANRHADERIIGWGDPVEVADADWPAQGSTCAHVCGPGPDHACDARATTRLAYDLPSGGTRSMPICGPCWESETAPKENAHA